MEKTSPATEPDDDDAVVDITGSLADTTHLADSVVKTTSTVELLSLLMQVRGDYLGILKQNSTLSIS